MSEILSNFKKQLEKDVINSNVVSISHPILNFIIDDHFDKVYIFKEGQKILRNLHRRFVLCSASQIYGGDFANSQNFVASSEYMNFKCW